MIKKVEIGGVFYEYELTFKKVKNLNLRISADGFIKVSAPLYCPETEVEKFVIKNEKFIIRGLDRLSKKDENSFYIFGGKYNKKVVTGDKNSFAFDGITVTFYIKNENFYKPVEQAFLKYLSEKYLPEIIEKVKLKFSGKIEVFPPFKYRYMTSRWGVCHKKPYYITLSTRLVTKPVKAVEYVIAHEISHLKVFNHSKKFYGFLSTVYPD